MKRYEYIILDNVIENCTVLNKYSGSGWRVIQPVVSASDEGGCYTSGWLLEREKF